MLKTLDLAAEIPRLAQALPPFPRVVMGLLDLLRNDELSIDTLARMARNDPVIAGNILATANHVRRLRAQSDLSDPFAAASLIGLNRVRNIVVAAGMNRFLAQSGATPFFYAHSLAVAIISQELALISEVSAEDAYVAGILHDIGQLCFYVLDHAAYDAVTAKAVVDGRLVDHETAVFGMDHCQVGRLLAEYWNLPEGVLLAIATHHDESEPTSRLQATVTLAEMLSRALDLPSSPNNRINRINPLALEVLGLKWDSQALLDCLGRCRARYRQALPRA